MISRPMCHKYLSLRDNPFLTETWEKARLPELMKDLSWVDREDLPVSKDYNDEDFPAFWNWPAKWQAEFRKAETEALELLIQYVSSFEKFTLGSCTVYINEGNNEVFVSSPAYDNGYLSRAEPRNVFDSVSTAAFAFVNDYNHWHSKFGMAYKATNITSSSTSNFTDK